MGSTSDWRCVEARRNATTKARRHEGRFVQEGLLRAFVSSWQRPRDGCAMSDNASTSRRIKELEVMVADVVVETPDTATLVFFTGNDRLEYSAGHFLTIDPHQFDALERFTAFLEDLKERKEPPRAYSMSSAPHERYLAVTVKE